LPDPCAKRTTPRRPSGTSSAPSSTTDPAGIATGGPWGGPDALCTDGLQRPGHLAQSAGMIGIDPLGLREVVGEELDRHPIDGRRERALCPRRDPDRDARQAQYRLFRGEDDGL